MKTQIPDIKPKILFTLLIVLSIISTIHIWFHYQLDVGIKETITILQAPDTTGLKEVGFTDFVVNAVRRIFILFL